MFKALLITLAVLAAGTGLILIGQDDETANAAERDRAFLQSMVPHHESAIEMGKIAIERAETHQVKQLGLDIVEAQEREIAQMKSIHERLFDKALLPDERAHESLGLSASEAGMNHGPQSAAELRTANPFNRAFIDEMTPHHEGAIRMAKAVLMTTRDDEIKRLARDIITAQKEEIRLMAEIRLIHYGPASPDLTMTPAAGHGGH